jgi:hypothetical protein
MEAFSSKENSTGKSQRFVRTLGKANIGMASWHHKEFMDAGIKHT